MAVTKVIEVVGSSTNGADDAVREAVRSASRSIRGITEVEVLSLRCTVSDGDVAQWQARVKLFFPVEAR